MISSFERQRFEKYFLCSIETRKGTEWWGQETIFSLDISFSIVCAISVILLELVIRWKSFQNVESCINKCGRSSGCIVFYVFAGHNFANFGLQWTWLKSSQKAVALPPKELYMPLKMSIHGNNAKHRKNTTNKISFEVKYCLAFSLNSRSTKKATILKLILALLGGNNSNL